MIFLPNMAHRGKLQSRAAANWAAIVYTQNYATYFQQLKKIEKSKTLKNNFLLYVNTSFLGRGSLRFATYHSRPQISLISSILLAPVLVPSWIES